MTHQDPRFVFSFEQNECPEQSRSQIILGQFCTTGEQGHLSEYGHFVSKDLFQHLHGEWALIQTENGIVRLVRDKIGIVPLYYFADGSNLYVSTCFSSLIHKKGALSINKKHMQNIKRFNFFDKTSTIDLEIHRVPPGHYIEIFRNKVTIHQYWQIADTMPDNYRDDLPSSKRLQITLIRAIQERAESQKQFALFLSGGFDSSAIFSALCSHKESAAEWQALSYVFKDESEIEKRNLQILEEKFGKQIVMVPFSTVSSESYLYKDWPMSVFFSPGLSMLRPLFRLASQLGSKYVWSGQGSDETYVAPPQTTFFLPLSEMKMALTKEKSWHLKVRFLIKLVAYRVVYNIYRLRHPKGRFLLPHARSLYLFLRNGGYLFGIESAQEFAAQMGLRMSYPLLDDRALVTFYNAKPNEVIDDAGIGKRILRDALDQILPNSIRLRRSDQNYLQIFENILKPLYNGTGNATDDENYLPFLTNLYEQQLQMATSNTKVEIGFTQKSQ